MSDGRTHWEGCEREHLDCALAKLRRAEARVAELEGSRGRCVNRRCRGRDPWPLFCADCVADRAAEQHEASVKAERERCAAICESMAVEWLAVEWQATFARVPLDAPSAAVMLAREIRKPPEGGEE